MAEHLTRKTSDALRNLEVTFGRVPKVIEENMRYFDYDDNTDLFICIACDVKIKRVDNDKKITIGNFKSHVTSEKHSKNTTSIHEIHEALMETFSGKIPQVVANNIVVLGMDEINYNCLICERIIPSSPYICTMEENFSYHLLSRGHLENLEKYRENIRLLQEVCGEIPSVISSNSDFLTQKGKNYFCDICKKLLLVDATDLGKTQESFEDHMLSKEHLRNTKQYKAFSSLPELKPLFNTLPSVILKNVMYFSSIGGNIYCSLCCDIIKCKPDDPFETEHNFKLHISSDEHKLILLCRRDENNKVFLRLKEIFDVFSEKVMVNLEYLTMMEENFFCNACEQFVNIPTVVGNGAKKVIIENITKHFESSIHENNVSDQIEQRSLVIKDLEEVFGCIPESVQANIEHIQNIGDNFECSLCDKTIIGCSGSAQSAAQNFKTHFESDGHTKEIQNLEDLSQALENDFEFLFGSIPQFIIKSWNVLGYDESQYNFYCFLCDDKIKVVYGSKKRELTLQNLRNHMHSTSHLLKLKEKANKEFKVSEQLAFFFGSIPSVVLNNAEHLRRYEEDFLCDLCGVIIRCDDPKLKFKHHLSNLRHKKKVQDIEESKIEAKKCLDSALKIWNIPGFLLKNLDLMSLSASGNDFLCVLCQLIIPVKFHVEDTKRSLRLHFDSEKHQHNVKHVSCDN